MHSLRPHRSAFATLGKCEVKGIFYCIIFTLGNSGSYLHTFELLFVLTEKKFSKLLYLFEEAPNLELAPTSNKRPF